MQWDAGHQLNNALQARRDLVGDGVAIDHAGGSEFTTGTTGAIGGDGEPIELQRAGRYRHVDGACTRCRDSDRNARDDVTQSAGDENLWTGRDSGEDVAIEGVGTRGKVSAFDDDGRVANRCGAAAHADNSVNARAGGWATSASVVVHMNAICSAAEWRRPKRNIGNDRCMVPCIDQPGSMVKPKLSQRYNPIAPAASVAKVWSGLLRMVNHFTLQAVRRHSQHCGPECVYSISHPMVTALPRRSTLLLSTNRSIAEGPMREFEMVNGSQLRRYAAVLTIVVASGVVLMLGLARDLELAEPLQRSLRK